MHTVVARRPGVATSRKRRLDALRGTAWSPAGAVECDAWPADTAAATSTQLHPRYMTGGYGSVAEWLACWTQAQKGTGF